MREICFSTLIRVLLTIPATAVLFNFIYLFPHNSSLLLADSLRSSVRLFYLILCFWPITYLFCPKFYTIFGAGGHLSTSYTQLVYSCIFASILYISFLLLDNSNNSNHYYLAGLRLRKIDCIQLIIVNPPREQKIEKIMRPKCIGLALYA